MTTIRRKAAFAALIALGLLAAVPPLRAQRPGFPPEEFTARRAALMERLKDGTVILFGDAAAPAGGHFRQDNDFYYFTGSDDLGAILVLYPAAKSSFLFLPQLTAREKMYDGGNLLDDPAARARAGFTDVLPSSSFDEFMTRGLSRADGVRLHLRLSPRDALDQARSEVALYEARRARTRYHDQISADLDRIAKIRERYPQMELRDVTPLIDEMRAVKTPAEIEVLRRNGRLSAEAVKQAMLAGRPGAYEYEIEAAAMAVVLKGGAGGAAYAPIVGSGPNSCILHYDQNSRQVRAGEVVLMDFGADLGHLAMDITRTWPASGRFTDEQRETYRTALEVQKACIEAYKPGATPRDVRDHVSAVLKAKGIAPRGLAGGFGHGVGLSVHDVPLGGVLKQGMVFAIEPGLYDEKKGFGVRIEDTVLITADGCEVLTAGVPKEIAEIEKLLAGRGR